jgi:2-polyprenyl-3-methyl-5-hydroxy-6-metoxy-1,4-benzoquinol methylase
MEDRRRKYYDHESAYQRIASRGGAGWDDLTPGAHQGSYEAIDAFLGSHWCPPPESSPRALDVGCGGGQVALRLARRGFAVTAVDFSETAIDLARSNAARDGANIECLVGDCIDLAMLEDASFDLVVDNHLLHCLIGADRLAFLRSAYRVMRPGGVMFSDTMCHGPRLAFEALGIDPGTRVTHNRTRFWATEAELAAELASAGLEVVHQELREEADEPNVGRMLMAVLRRP